MPALAGSQYWRAVTNRLAREATSRVTATYLRYAEGAITLDEMVGIQAQIIAAAQRRAVTVNDLMLAAEISSALEREYAAVGIDWDEPVDRQIERLARAATSVVQAEPEYLAAAKTAEQAKALEAASIRGRLQRLTTGETTRASQWARDTAGRIWADDGVVTGWYRQLSGDACDRCRALVGQYSDSYNRLYRGGRGTVTEAPRPGAELHPPAHRFAIRHPGCTCVQVWFAGEIEPWQRTVGAPEFWTKD